MKIPTMSKLCSIKVYSINTSKFNKLHSIPRRKKTSHENAPRKKRSKGLC